jgi:hypothetical protein
MATLGLACNIILWSVPVLVSAAALPHALFPAHAPTSARVLATATRSSGQAPSLPDAFVHLIGAESEALEVAGLALQQPLPRDLAPRADAAGSRVLAAISVYVRAAEALLDRTRGD